MQFILVKNDFFTQPSELSWDHLPFVLFSCRSKSRPPNNTFELNANKCNKNTRICHKTIINITKHLTIGAEYGWKWFLSIYWLKSIKKIIYCLRNPTHNDDLIIGNHPIQNDAIIMTDLKKMYLEFWTQFDERA